MIVVDTNIISYFYLTCEYSDLAEKCFQKDSDWVAPVLWRSEFRNILALYGRKNIINWEQAAVIMQDAEFAMKDNEFTVVSSAVFQLVERSMCSAYDCEFVALAKDLNIPLVTMDKKILNHFPEIATSLPDFLSPTI